MPGPVVPNTNRLLRLSRSTTISLTTVMIADLVAVCAELFYLDYLRSIPGSTNVAESELVASELFNFLSAAGQVAAHAVTAVLFVKWFRQAYVNVTAVTGRLTDYSSRWAILGFFVPFVNLVRPRRIMREIWDSAEAKWIADDPRVAGRPVPADKVNLWWGLLLSATILSNIAGRIATKATTAQQLIPATMFYLIADCVDVAAAIVAIVLVRSVTQLQYPLLAGADAGGLDAAQPDPGPV